jgi:hypothetical protein
MPSAVSAEALTRLPLERGEWPVNAFLLEDDWHISRERLCPAKSIKHGAWTAGKSLVNKFVVGSELVQQLYFPARQYLLATDRRLLHLYRLRPVEQLFALLKPLALFRQTPRAFAEPAHAPNALLALAASLGPTQFCALCLQLCADFIAGATYRLSIPLLLEAVGQLPDFQSAEEPRAPTQELLLYLQRAAGLRASQPGELRALRAVLTRQDSAQPASFAEPLNAAENRALFEQLLRLLQDARFFRAEAQGERRAVTDSALLVLLARLLCPVWDQPLLTVVGRAELNFSQYELRLLLDRLAGFEALLAQLRAVR